MLHQGLHHSLKYLKKLASVPSCEGSWLELTWCRHQCAEFSTTHQGYCYCEPLNLKQHCCASMSPIFTACNTETCSWCHTMHWGFVLERALVNTIRKQGNIGGMGTLELCNPVQIHVPVDWIYLNHYDWLGMSSHQWKYYTIVLQWTFVTSLSTRWEKLWAKTTQYS